MHLEFAGMKSINIKFCAMAALIAFSMIGCYRGSESDKPPIHLERNMYNQQKYKPQSESQFFPDSSAMRQLPAGVVARGQLLDDLAYYNSINDKGDTVTISPLPFTIENLRRGQQRFNIYCSACHGRVGDGQGIVVQRGFIPPPTFHSDRLRQTKDGHYFDVITKGIRNMPAYRYQISTLDRWAIVDYVRALQRSQNATIKDIPSQTLRKLR
jgi:mono/diheme cytochrome c family protein